MQEADLNYHHSSPDEGNGEPKKRQRIQQACKSCGIKRVKVSQLADGAARKGSFG